MKRTFYNQIYLQKKECKQSAQNYKRLRTFAEPDNENGKDSMTTPNSSPESSNYRTSTSGFSEPNNDVMAMLRLILDKQIRIEKRLNNLEANIIPKTDVMAHHKVLRETKVLLKNVHKLECGITGEKDLHTEIAMMMPMQSLDTVFDLEEKMSDKNFEAAVITYLLSLKGTSEDLGGVAKCVFSDKVLSLFNWGGGSGKKALSKLKVVHVALFEIFKLRGRITFEQDFREYVTLSHNRIKQRRYIEKRKSNLT